MKKLFLFLIILIFSNLNAATPDVAIEKVFISKVVEYIKNSNDTGLVMVKNNISPELITSLENDFLKRYGTTEMERLANGAMSQSEINQISDLYIKMVMNSILTKKIEGYVPLKLDPPKVSEVIAKSSDTSQTEQTASLPEKSTGLPIGVIVVGVFFLIAVIYTIKNRKS